MSRRPLELPVVTSEERARKTGRSFAKRIFTTSSWRKLRTNASDDVELYERIEDPATDPQHPKTRCLRAIRMIHGTLAEMEELLSATCQSLLYATLVPDLYVSGGMVVDHKLVQHSTKEREYTNVQFAVIQSPRTGPSSRKRPLDRHLLLEYALVTSLQPQTGAASAPPTPAPSLLYVLRPIAYPEFSCRHAEYGPDRLSTAPFGVTYVIQETSETGVLSLEVLLTIPASSAVGENAENVDPLRTESSWREVIALTRFEPLLEMHRVARRRPTPTPASAGSAAAAASPPPSRNTTTAVRSRATPTSPPRRETEPGAAGPRTRSRRTPPTSTSSSTTTATSTSTATSTKAKQKRSTADGKHAEADADANAGKRCCSLCHKRFHAFRWKKHCEVCGRTICDQCVSTIANPTVMRKKKRVCNGCLYGGGATGRAPAVPPAPTTPTTTTVVAPVPPPNPSLPPRTPKAPKTPTSRTPRTPRTPRSPSAGSGITRTEDGAVVAPSLPPMPMTTTTTTSKPQTEPIRVSVRPPPPPPPTSAPMPFVALRATTIGDTGARSSEDAFFFAGIAAASVGTRASEECSGYSTATTTKTVTSPTAESFYEDTDPSGVASDDEFVVSNRCRRAKTIEIGDVATLQVSKIQRKTSGSSGNSAEDKASARAAAIRARRRSFSGEDLPQRQTFNLGDFELRLSKPAVSYRSKTAPQFRQLKTPAISYELDFDWLHAFPKAPLPREDVERARREFLSTQLPIDAHMAMVYLRRDSVLEEITQEVIGGLATQWDGCSIHLIGEEQVFCLAYSYQAPLPIDDDALAVVIEDVVARDESPSSHALFHRGAFFLSDLGDDDRFRAHPLHADGRVISYLSLPIYSTVGGGGGSSRRNSVCGGNTEQCIGTMDLWRFDPSGASSHVSHEWWQAMERMLRRTATRIEELAFTHRNYTFPKTRQHKSRSIGSSCDSRGSTRKEDSFELMDLRDLEEDEVILDSDEEDGDGTTGWTSSPLLGKGISGRGWRKTVTDRYADRSNGSFVSTGSASSDLEATIESLLQQATRTSQYIREQNHTCAM